MTQLHAITEDAHRNNSHLFSRTIAFLYGLIAYAVFFVSFLYAIGFVEGLIVPTTIDAGISAPTWTAVIIDLALMSIFAMQHSVMARKQFKRWWAQFVPASVERTTYVLLASLALALLLWQWSPIPVVVWHVTDPHVAMTITALSFLGWLIVLT